MLQGILKFKDPQLGIVTYNVLARHTLSDFKLYLIPNENDFTEMSKAELLYDKHTPSTIPKGYELDEHLLQMYNTRGFFDLFDRGIPTKQKDGTVVVMKAESYRRIDVKDTNKLKTNVSNRDFSVKVGAFLRYVQIIGRKKYNSGDNEEFSSTRKVDLGNLGVIDYCMGFITAIRCANDFMMIELNEISDDGFDCSIFKDLKKTDKFGNVASVAPIDQPGFKLCKETLGFEYTPAIKEEFPNVLGLFESIEDVIRNNPDKETSWILKRNYVIVSDDNLEEIIAKFMAYNGLIAFDTETSGLRINFKSRTGEADQLVGVVLSMEKGTGYYFPLQHKLFDNLCDGDHHYFMDRYMRPILEGKEIIVHNAKFDWKVAYIYGINTNIVYDTMLAFGVTERYKEESFRLGLKELVRNIFGLDMFDLSDFVTNGSFSNSGIAFWDLPYELVRRYAPADADMTLALYEYLEMEDKLNKFNAKKVFKLEVDFAIVAAYSEFYGYHINVDKIPQLTTEIMGEMEKYKQEMFKIAGEEFNPNSPAQLSKLMYDTLGIEMINDQRSTNKEILGALAKYEDMNGDPKYPFVSSLKKYRDNEGIYKNFLKKLHIYSSTDGYIFPETMPLGTNTGRTSTKEPNYQSYNDVVKKYIVPRPDFMTGDSDFAQIEQRVLASMAQQEQLIADFEDPDMDYHTYQAARMFNIPYATVPKTLRQQSKGINFGLPYGMGDSSLGVRIFGERNKENTIKAGELRRKFFVGQEKIQSFFELHRDNGVRNGFTETDFGRRRYYHRGTFTAAEIRRQAGNHVIQGCLHGDTRIQTQEYGIVRLKDVVGKTLNVWNGTKWTRGDIMYSGKKQKSIVRFSGGQEIVCSPIHKFLTVSNKGNPNFVTCEELRTIKSHSNPHRVAINRKYEPSAHKYVSNRVYDSFSHNAKNAYLDDITDSFDKGTFLGRLASDGSFTDRQASGGSSITHFISEHEYNILPKLKEIMNSLGYSERNIGVREDRNESMTHLNVYSKSLVNEVVELDIKHQLHDSIFMDTELLRGFLRGFFDGDGGISGKTIMLTFGTQYDFEPMCLDIQKALLFFGIRSRYRVYADRYVIQIKTNDNARFLDMIGFLNEDKQAKGRDLVCVTEEKIFGPTLVVESVDITDDYIDMYDVCNTEDGYYVADGIITHNTAADIYKIACVQLFKRVVKEGWLGLVLFNAFVHDELVFEIHRSINPYYFTKVWREEFEVKIEGYCRLYAGLGYAKCWYDAKKQDLQPQFIDELVAEYSDDMEWDEDTDKFVAKLVADFADHKVRRVKTFITAEEHQNDVIKPMISTLLVEVVSAALSKASVEVRNELNGLLGAKLIKTDSGKHSIKNLQHYLKVFCYFNNIVYDDIKILDPEDVAPVQNSADAFEEHQEMDFGDISEDILSYSFAQARGYYCNFMSNTVYLMNLSTSTGANIVKYCIDKGYFTQDGELEVKLYVDPADANSCAVTQAKLSKANYELVKTVFNTLYIRTGF